MQAHDTPRCAFIDMNSFFASVEQQYDEDLRDRPIAVVPMLSDSTCVIAASYEAKAFGIKTGTPIPEAYRLCPTIKLVEAHTSRYMKVNETILECLKRFFVEIKPLSID